MPLMALEVKEKIVQFLEDLKAGKSVIKSNEFFSPSKLRVRIFAFGRASVILVTEQFSAPLKCKFEGRGSLKFSFVISECCLVNLLRRDLMCAFNTGISSNHTELSVSYPRDVLNMNLEI